MKNLKNLNKKINKKTEEERKVEENVLYKTPQEIGKTEIKIQEGDNGKPENKKPEIENPNIDIFKKKLPLLDILAPSSIEIDFNHIKINDTFYRTIFVAGYPRFVSPGWLEAIINFNSSLDISFYVYPIEGKSVLDDLRRKITEMEAEIATDLQRGKIVDPNTQVKLGDALALQEQLVKGAERLNLVSILQFQPQI